MRLLVVSAAFAACVVSAATAQDGQPAPEPFAPRFESTNVSVQRIYPPRALDQGQGAVAHMCCAAREDRTLECNLSLLSPRNAGFESAAQTFVRGRRLTEEAYTELQAQPSPTFQLALRWHVLPLPAGFEEAVARIHAHAVDVCGPGTGPAPEYIVINAERR